MSHKNLLPRLNVQVSNTHTAPLLEGPERLDDLIKTDVRVESGLNVREDHDGTISSATTMSEVVRLKDTSEAQNVPELALGLHSWGDGNGVVESETESLVSLITALVVEHVVLQIVANGEQSAALGVHELRAIGASGTASD